MGYTNTTTTLLCTSRVLLYSLEYFGRALVGGYTLPPLSFSFSRQHHRLVQKYWKYLEKFVKSYDLEYKYSNDVGAVEEGEDGFQIPNIFTAKFFYFSISLKK